MAHELWRERLRPTGTWQWPVLAGFLVLDVFTANQVWAKALLVAGAVCCVVVWAGVTGEYVAVSGEGVVRRRIWRTIALPWADVDHFTLRRFGFGARSVPMAVDKTGRRRPLGSRMQLADAERLVARLNAALAGSDH